MLYYRCPTCKTVLADKQLLFEDKMLEICNNKKLSVEDKEQHKMNLLTDLEINRYCCRMRMLTYVSLVELVK